MRPERAGAVLVRVGSRGSRLALTQAEAAVGDLDAPGVSYGAEDRLLVVPSDPADLDAVVSANCSGSSRDDTPVH